MAKAQPLKVKINSITTLPKQVQRTGFFKGFKKHNRRKQLVASVVAVYLVIGGLVGFVLFNNNSGPAKADESALISSSIKLVNEREYKLGELVEVGIVLQNTSVTESINTLSVEMFSTKDAIKWLDVRKVSAQTNKNEVIGISEGNVLKLPVLSSGERAEYVIEGTLQDNQIDYLNIIGKVNFLNKDGAQYTETNRIFGKVNSGLSGGNSLVTLKSGKDVYTEKEAPSLNVQVGENQQSKGKIYISNKDTSQLVASGDCEPKVDAPCEFKPKDLTPASYSALYIDEANNTFSNIANFIISGKKGDFIPNKQATLELPFGQTSINGGIQVIAKRVLSLNQIPSANSVCTFEVLFQDNVVSSIEAVVESDRSCKSTLSSESFTRGDGLYKIRLKGSELVKEVSYINKAATLLTLENKTAILETGKSVQVEAINILDENSQPVDNVKGELFIWHTNTGSFDSLSSVNGESLKATNGSFQATIPGSNLTKGGFYMVYLKLENGLQSDWLALSYVDREIAFSGTGILFDSNNFRVGENASFNLENITDRSGNIVEDAICTANFYTSSISEPISINGTIKKGICNVVLPAGRITTAGPILVSFTSPETTTKINQSKHIYINPGQASQYGKLSLEYQPARRGYATNVFIGPVTDKFGNLVSDFNYSLKISGPQGDLITIPNITITDGFATVTIPSSIMALETVNVALINSTGNEVLTKVINTQESSDPLIYANIPDSLSSDSSLKVDVKGINVANQSECQLVFTKSDREVAETPTAYRSEDGSCTFDFDFNRHRTTKQALVEVVIGDIRFAKPITLTNSDPVNLFTISPEVQINSQNELNLALLTSPIVDKQGKPVQSGEVTWQYNGKVTKTQIENGLARLTLLANSLESKDILSLNNQRFLDIDLDVKASISSISKTNNLNIYLGNRDISNSLPKFSIVKANNQVAEGSTSIFQFETDFCQVRLLNPNYPAQKVKTHWQGGICYVEVPGVPGKNTLSFELNGFTLGQYTYTSTTLNQEVVWCTEGEAGCIIQVLAQINSEINVQVVDGDNIYTFKNNNLENTVVVKQNGLNPLKQYRINVEFQNNRGENVVYTHHLLGEKLAE